MTRLIKSSTFVLGLKRNLRRIYIYNKILTFFDRLGHTDVFNLIHKHNLFDSIQDKIIMLMDFDREVAITTCCNLSIEVEMFTRNSRFLTRKQLVPHDSITEEVSFEWSGDKISSTDFAI